MYHQYVRHCSQNMESTNLIYANPYSMNDREYVCTKVHVHTVITILLNTINQIPDHTSIN